MRTVKYGMGSRSKPDATVAAAQAGMTIKGHPDRRSIAANGADGIARSGTREQTESFQRATGIPVTGEVGNLTWIEIDKE